MIKALNVSLHYRIAQRGTPAVERVPGGREPSSEGTFAAGLRRCRTPGGPRRRKLASDWNGKGLLAILRLAKPDAMPGWRLKPAAAAPPSSTARSTPDRPRIRQIEPLARRLARENSGSSYNRVLANLGRQLSGVGFGERHGKSR
jgi:hypothetical protein